MDKKYGKKGLRILAPEMQESELKDIQKHVDKFKMTFPIIHGIGKTEGSGTTQPKGRWAIPWAIVFDVNGKEVYRGKSWDPKFEKAVVKALEGVKKEKEKDNE